MPTSPSQQVQLRLKVRKNTRTDQESKELENLYKQSNNPVDDWIKSKRDEIKNNIKPLTKFIVKGF